MPHLALMAQATGDTPSLWQLVVPWVLIGGIFYVLLILPQRRRQKAHEKMVQELRAGDKVVTSGGLEGTITRVEDGKLRVKLAPQVEVTVMRTHIAGKAGDATS